MRLDQVRQFNACLYPFLIWGMNFPGPKLVRTILLCQREGKVSATAAITYC